MSLCGADLQAVAMISAHFDRIQLARQLTIGVFLLCSCTLFTLFDHPALSGRRLFSILLPCFQLVGSFTRKSLLKWLVARSRASSESSGWPETGHISFAKNVFAAIALHLMQTLLSGLIAWVFFKCTTLDFH